MGTLWQDLRYTLRMLARSPGFTIVAVLTLALGIGANTTIFSVVDSLMLRSLPIKAPEQTAILAFHQGNGHVQFFFSYPGYVDTRDQASASFSGLTCYVSGMDGLAVNGKPDRIMTDYVSGNYFSVLGLKPALGRLILPSEGIALGSDPVMVLSYSYWKAHFGGDPNVIGRTVSVNAHPITIVGIAPAGFVGTNPFLQVQGFLPLGMASIGIYAALAYAISQRTREIGIRMALGAQRGEILALVMGRTMVLVFWSIGFGLLGALALNRIFSRSLRKVGELDVATCIAVAILLGVVALAASYFPSRKALRVDPVQALRCE